MCPMRHMPSILILLVVGCSAPTATKTAPTPKRPPAPTSPTKEVTPPPEGETKVTPRTRAAPTWRVISSGELGPDLERLKPRSPSCGRWSLIQDKALVRALANDLKARLDTASLPSGAADPASVDAAEWTKRCAPDLDGDGKREWLTQACWLLDAKKPRRSCARFKEDSMQDGESITRVTEVLLHDGRSKTPRSHGPIVVTEEFVGETSFCEEFQGFVRLPGGDWAAKIGDRSCFDNGNAPSWCYSHEYVSVRQAKLTSIASTTMCQVSGYGSHEELEVWLRARANVVLVHKVQGTRLRAAGLERGDVITRLKVARDGEDVPAKEGEQRAAEAVVQALSLLTEPDVQVWLEVRRGKALVELSLRGQADPSP